MKNLLPDQPAPQFEHRSIDGQNVSLDQFRGKKVLLSFFRGAACPFCNMRVRELMLNFEVLKKQNIRVIAVFHATKKEILEFAGKQQVPFPILPDPNFNLYRTYGIESSLWGKFKTMGNLPKVWKVMNSGFFNLKSMGDPNTLPADFLIGEDQKIKFSYYGQDFGDHIPLNLILENSTL
ncbi:MAG: peroxiredoxin-like family protein [Anditalea sp.]